MAYQLVVVVEGAVAAVNTVRCHTHNIASDGLTVYCCSHGLLLILNRLLGLLLVLAAAQDLGQTVPHAAHEQCTEQVLERHERVVDAEQDRGQLKVDQEDDDAKVDEGVRCRNEVRLFVQHKDDRRHQRGLRVAVGAGRERIAPLLL